MASEGWGLLTGHQRGPRPDHTRGLSHGHGQIWQGDRKSPSPSGRYGVAAASAASIASTETSAAGAVSAVIAVAPSPAPGGRRRLRSPPGRLATIPGPSHPPPAPPPPPP